MVILKRIGVVSAGRIGFWMGIAGSLTQLVIFLFFLTIVGNVSITDIPFVAWQRIFFSTLIGGFITAFSVGAYAYVYNLNADRFGGLELEFEPVDSPRTPKAKNKAPVVTDEDTTVV